MLFLCGCDTLQVLPAGQSRRYPSAQISEVILAIAVSLWFDKNSEAMIRSIWEELHHKQLASFLWTGNFRPHVTLAIYDKLDVTGFKASLSKYLLNVPTFQITLPSIGLFSAPPGELSVSGNAVFLSVTPTSQLLEIHNQIHSLLSNFGRDPRQYYLPGKWNPHSTIAREISLDSIPKIISFCQGISLPIRPVVNRIGIIDTPAEIELEVCVLNDEG